MTSRTAAVFGSTVLCALALAVPAHATFPGANGKIAFGAEHSLYTINPDGSGETAIDPQRNCAYDPDWSADGTKLAFDGCGNVGVINADGSGSVTDLSPCAGCFPGPFGRWSDAPSWNPDGVRIADTEVQSYGSEETGFYATFDIHVVDVDGAGNVQLTDDDVSRAPEWSPDGTKIGFTRGGIYTMNQDGSGSAKVPNTSSGDYLTSWSPDGGQLLFTRGPDLYKLNLDGTGITRLTTSPAQAWSYGADWSPDGQKIAFVVETINPFTRTLKVMNADGSGQTALATTFGPFGRVSWQAIPGPRRADYRNAAKFCKAQREFLGDGPFARRYGGGANAYGKCVSGK